MAYRAGSAQQATWDAQTRQLEAIDPAEPHLAIGAAGPCRCGVDRYSLLHDPINMELAVASETARMHEYPTVVVSIRRVARRHGDDARAILDVMVHRGLVDRSGRDADPRFTLRAAVEPTEQPERTGGEADDSEVTDPASEATAA